MLHEGFPFHQFKSFDKMTEELPWKRICQEYAGDIEKGIRIRRARGTVDLGFPDLIPIKPLEPKGQWYLFETVSRLSLQIRIICKLIFFVYQRIIIKFCILVVGTGYMNKSEKKC